ncbi:MAG: UDP-N-acetylglucosamine 2-epimerase (non-hydrolyzing) [Tetragenococcus halophilus]|nr:UDP-N-acetylglucosamine 2-epimerase (non-hydrolyzing) [Tetragenococcus halophilus]
MEKKKIAIVFGTRPEAIKMAPVILELKKYQQEFEPCIIVSAQHREMLDQVLSVFSIKPDYDLDIMKPNQSLSDITADVLKGIETIFVKENPDMVLVHGDTTTSFAAALAAYYHQIPIGHVEAGLRTHDKYFPFPEEVNRQLIDTITDIFFAPTELTKQNLLNEGKDETKIVVTGNTVIDAVYYTKNSKVKHPALDLMDSKPEQKWILLTSHRRENYGEPMRNIFEAILEIVEKRSDVEVILPVHLSPSVQKQARKSLGNHARIHLIEPLEVEVFHQVINKAYLILTDSGGLQEEAPALNKPVLVLRDKTERPEGLEEGTLRVIGTNKNKITSEVLSLIEDNIQYEQMSNAVNPYGDGLASQRIVKKLFSWNES